MFVPVRMLSTHFRLPYSHCLRCLVSHGGTEPRLFSYATMTTLHIKGISPLPHLISSSLACWMFCVSFGVGVCAARNPIQQHFGLQPRIHGKQGTADFGIHQERVRLAGVHPPFSPTSPAAIHRSFCPLRSSIDSLQIRERKRR